MGYFPPIDAAAQAQTTPTSAKAIDQSDILILGALAKNPVTAPYRFRVERVGDRWVLAGRVGTKVIYDEAIRTALAVTSKFTDRLVIDTAAVEAAAPAGGATPISMGNMWPWGFTTYPGGIPYVYPTPLFQGWWLDPFEGMEPPLISYPPWWNGMSAARPGDSSLLSAPGAVGPQLPTGVGDVDAGAVASDAIEFQGASAAAPAIEMTIDPRGVAILRGKVSSLAERIAIGQRIAQTEGVTDVVNLITVAGENAPPAAAKPAVVPPPPPPGPAAPGEGPASAPAPSVRKLDPSQDSDPLALDVRAALAEHPELAATPLQVEATSDDAVILSGSVPSAYEAMIAYLAVRRTPGVKSIDDRLRFPVPNSRGGSNPLRDRGRPEDVAEYLKAQLERRIQGQAIVHALRVDNDTLLVDLVGSQTETRKRVDAILRSFPLARGYRIESRWTDERP
jgi:hypothetical protein